MDTRKPEEPVGSKEKQMSASQIAHEIMSGGLYIKTVQLFKNL